MEDNLETFNVAVDGVEYLVIPGMLEDDTLISTFMIVLDGVKVGDLSMDENSMWRWSDSALLPEEQDKISGAIGEAIESHDM